MPGGGEQAMEPGQEAAAAAGRELEVAKSRGGASGALRGALALAEARRRLLEAEGRRRLVSELERRVHQLHRVFVEAELRLAHRAESLGRLGGGVAQAELQLAAGAAAAKGSGGAPLHHGPRLRKKPLPRGRPPPPKKQLLRLASALGGCVPWAGGQKAPPESPFCRRRGRRPSLPGAAPPAANAADAPHPGP